ncbi:MAG: lysophospholipid acyltransferase family protein [Candidatus Omnitrophica bacterium]|nr:lysophospholipid acyltransferase family protein [Candidatus Omnitrophota bacterium]
MKIKTRRYVIYYILKIFIFITFFVPRSISLKIAEFLGKAAFHILTKHRDTVIANLNSVFSDDERLNRNLAEDVFVNLAKTGADWIKLLRYDREHISSLITEVSGLEYVDQTLAKGKGAILLASHFGNWELISLYFKFRGHEGGVIARRIYFHKYNKLLVRIRSRFGIRIIYRDDSPKEILRMLKSNGILGILADQDVDSVAGVFVDFFGKPAYTPTAPVALSMATGADIVPVFMLRKSDNTYKMILEKPIQPSLSVKNDENVLKYTQEWTRVLETYVRKYPGQWAWVHKRWKTRA